MNRRNFLAAACLLSSAATGIAQTNVTLNFQVAGKTRNSVVHVPSGTSKPAVVFFIHGATGSGANFQRETRGDATADREKFIAVYPSASANGASGTWDDMQGTGNFPFFLAIIDTLNARYQIDKNRIYMTGFSQGGFISFAAGCFYSDVFAAIAPVSGHAVKPCTIKRPVPTFMTWGGNEGTSFLADRDLWVGFNKCTGTPTTTRNYPATTPNAKGTLVSYGTCDQGSAVQMDSISGQGHQWPGTSAGNHADEVWSFFKKYSLTGTTGLRDRKIAQGGEPITVSYSAGLLRMGGAGEGFKEGLGEKFAEKFEVKVADSHGRLVASGTAAQGRFAFKDQPSGVYVATVSGGGRSASRKFVIP
jgi:poly(3-hydroxybutyrate) depolymerase